jgi:chloramphenicol O-acetyltransferase type B
MLEYYWSKILKKIRGSALKNSFVHKTSKVESGTSFIYSSMDKHSFCGYNCDINHTRIGKFCSIANNVVIGGGMHPMNWVSTSPVFYEGRDSVKAKFSIHQRDSIRTTVIGHDVWIGQNVIIKQGVSIGTGSVIGMGSIVTKDVEPYTIVAGNPAKLIKKRFDDNIIKNLLQSKWWDINEKALNSLSKYIKEPKLFLKNIKS